MSQSRDADDSGALDPDDPGRPDPAARNARSMRRAVTVAILVGLGLDLLLVLSAALLAGAPQLWGALIGTALSLVVTIPTLATAHYGARGGIGTMAGVVLGGWLVKMVVLVIALLAVRQLGGVSLRWIGLALLLGAVVAAVVEGVLLLRHRTALEVTTGR